MNTTIYKTKENPTNCKMGKKCVSRKNERKMEVFWKMIVLI
jgi:hypothetical protein